MRCARCASWAGGVGLWHADRDLRGVDAVILQGGFSYGDYLRCGAIARSPRSWARCGDSPRPAAAVVGSATGSRSLCEAGLLPGALIGIGSFASCVMGGRPRREPPSRRSRRTWSAGEILRVPVKHGEGQFVASVGDLDRIERDGLVVFRYCSPEGATDEAHNPNGASNAIAGLRNEAGNVVGLMPHPEHAVDPDVGATGGQPMFASLLSSTLARVSAA